MSDSNGHIGTMPRIQEPVVTAPAHSRLFLFNLIGTTALVLIFLYQVFVMMPEIAETRKMFEAERVKEEGHARKIEALRKSQITEGALLLLDLQESRRIVKSLKRDE